MSAGAFQIATYGASYDPSESHPIRVQPETILATAGGVANAGLVGVPTNPISAVTSLGRRSKGLRPRFITMVADPTPPAGYLLGGLVRIPILDPDNFVAFSIPGTLVSYLGVTWRVISSDPERVR